MLTQDRLVGDPGPIQGKLCAGYGNVSEYFRSLLSDAQEREEDARLEALLVEGLATGGKDIPLTREFWTDLKAEAMDLARKHLGRKKRS